MHRFLTLPLALFFALSAAAAAQQIELLDFTADACPACRQMGPVLQDLVATGAPVRRVDVDRERELAARFRIEYLPTFVAVADGREVDRQVGVTSPERLREMLERARGSQETRAASQETGDNRQEPETQANALDSRPSTLDSLDSRLIASSVRLCVEDPQGISYGTGTIIAAQGGEAIVLTCGHIFRESQGKLPVGVELFEPSQESRVASREPESHSAGPRPLSLVARLEGEVLGYDLTRDVGLVRIRPTRPLRIAPLAARETVLQPGEEVVSVGCNNGQEPTVWHTHVTAINRYVGPANVEAAGTPVQGRSGGGLFNPGGELIGVCFAADDEGDEGLYVGLPAIYEELDRLQLTAMATATSAVAAAAQAPAAEHLLVSGITPAEQTRVSSRDLVPVSPADTELVSTDLPLSSEERAALEEIGQRSRGGEVIVIIRPKSPGDRCEILSLENPSREFVNELTALGTKATSPRFTSQKQPRQQVAPQEPQSLQRDATSQRVMQRRPTEHRRPRTQWTAVPPTP
jgi:thiol-disulfide isomerase/thioredoxin